MLSLFYLPEAQILLFALILLRMMAFVVSAAVIGSPTVIVPVKVLFSIVLAVLMFPLVKVQNPDYLVISNEIIGLAAREIIIGLSMGFLTRLFFFAVSMTGDLLSITMGLSSSQLFNPMMGTNGSSLEQFYSTVGTLVFLSINGHHLLIGALTQSFELVPVSSLSMNVGPFGEMALFAQDMFLMAVKMCAPVMVAILATNVGMGILGRAVPQINVLVTSMPVTIMLGIVLVFMTLPLMVIEMNGVLDVTVAKLFAVMKAI